MTFEPENALERSLIAAAQNESHQAQFMRDLLAADIYTISLAGGDEPAAAETQSLRVAQIQYDDQPYIPIFSSVQRLREFVKNKTRYVCMNARDFFEITRGAGMLLNPGSDCGKQFSATEIESLLDGSYWHPGQSQVITQEQKVMIGQPARYPDPLVKALKKLFKTLPQVSRAFLAHYHNPAEKVPPHTLIAIETKGDWDKVAQATGMMINQVEVYDPPVDVIRLTGKGGLGDYFEKDCQPFYQAK